MATNLNLTIKPKSATKNKFINAYVKHLKDIYDWPNENEDNLNRFIQRVRDVLNCDALPGMWDHTDTGPCVNMAWREIGGKGKPTLKDLQELKGYARPKIG